MDHSSGLGKLYGRIRSALSIDLGGVANLTSAPTRFVKNAQKKLVADFVTLLGIGMLAFAIIAGFAIFVMIISFIINTSAFVTPQGLLRSGLEQLNPGGGPSVPCTPDYEPLAFSNPYSNPTVSRAYEIVNNLHRGFWCYWNRSPDYPNLFDQSLFNSDPNVDPVYCEMHGCNLFWCTWLIIKAYLETGASVCPDCLYVPTMKNWFISQSRYITAANAFSNPAVLSTIQPGDVIFFRVEGSPRGDQGDHVAIVWQVNAPDSIVSIESNAGVKSATYTISGTDASWAGVHIIGFGTQH